MGDTLRLYDLANGSVAVRAALVIRVDEAELTVAVPEAEAPRLITALGAGGVVAAITRWAATPDW